MGRRPQPLTKVTVDAKPENAPQPKDEPTKFVGKLTKDREFPVNPR
jgi:hypothetical protein